MKISEQKVGNFFLDLASEKPAPGGGSAAALTGAMAAALVAKVINLTIGKEKYKRVESRFKQLKRQVEKRHKELLNLADKDNEAYLSVVKSKGSQESIKKAAEVPLITAQRSLAVLKMAFYVARHGNQNLRSDAFCAIKLAQAAIYGALENVRVNLPYLKDEKLVGDFKNKVDFLLNKTDSLIKP